ncbi:hypothetical protein AB0M87_07050 [Streptomyces sp. NPDC051320]|uniref:hypothetical protein n=1 Tax=Streptomyces sp. NPDC051320 TaxID=3154644 RepID=UPI00344A0847
MDERERPVPRAGEMRRQAAHFVAQVTAVRTRTARGRLPLDYSVASLRVADFMIDGLRKGAQERAQVAAMLFGLGAYVGEVLVRHANAEWVDLDVGQRGYFTQPVGVRLPDGRVWNPLGKVVNRYEVGQDESLQTFYLTLHGRHARAEH